MNLKTKKALASGTLALSLGALALGIAAVNPALANEEQQFDSTGSGTTSFVAETMTQAWCGWYLQGIDSSLTMTATSERYDGSEIGLSADDTGLEVFVGSSSTYSDQADNCSWYGSSNQQAAWVTVNANHAGFTGTADREVPDPTDDSMNFMLDSVVNPLTLTITAGETCASDNFIVDQLDSISDGDLFSNPVKSAIETDVLTTDRCGWDVVYGTKIPTGKVPKFGGVVYDFTGPTLTTTLEIQD
jgi:hypothetical protein